MRKLIVCAVLALAMTPSVYSVQLRAGRDVDPERSLSIEGSVGYLRSIDGRITETKRAYSDGSGPSSFSRYLENYDFSELGFDEDYMSYGLRLQKKWTYVTLGMAANYTKLTASGRAEREPFALGVGGIEFEGQSYDYMLIEQGQAYDAEIQTGLFVFNLDLTPFHIASEERWISFSPWFHLGLMAVLASYEIDAGPAKGVTTYEFHPYEYVINGKADGFNGGAVPEIGFGGELKMGLSERNERMMNLVLQGQYFFLDVDTSLGSFGVSSRNDKDVSIDYSGIEINAYLEIPLKDDRDLLLGLRYRHVEADIDVEAQRRSQAEQEALVEKYDKNAILEFDTVYGTVGITL